MEVKQNKTYQGISRYIQGIYPRGIFKSGIIFIGRKILKYSNDFYNWQFLISLQK